MADANIIQATFAAGEVAPDLYARVDLAKYHTGAAMMRNMFVNYKGGASSRPGTQFIGIPNPSGPNASLGPFCVRIRRFVFSAAQQYILVFSDHLLEFVRDPNPGVGAYYNSSNAGFILSGGPGSANYSITTPYAWQDLLYLKFSQSADIMNITHNNYPRMILSRFSDTNWTLTTPATGAGLPSPGSPALFITSPPSGSTDPLNTAYLYGVTAVGNTGEESTLSYPTYINGLDMSSTLGSILISWPSVAGAQYYKVYKTVSTSGGLTPSYGQQFGFIGFTYGTNFTDSNIVPDFAQGPPAHTDPFSPAQITGWNITSGGSGYPVEGGYINSPDASRIYPIFDNAAQGGTGAIVALYVADPGGGIANGTAITAGGATGSGFAATVTTGPANQNPKVSAFFQQRLMLASTPNNPVTLWGSKNGYYNNFDRSNPVVDNDALTFTLAVQEVNAIEWMKAFPSGLVLFTDSSVQELSGGSAAALSAAAVTPATATVTPISNFGANTTCEPIQILYEMLYVQSEGAIVRTLTYNPFFQAIYSGSDLTILSSHFFYPNVIVQWAYQDVPFKVVWAVRGDGVLLSLTYLKEQDVAGWAAHTTAAGGHFEGVEVIREGNQDAVYFVINRGGTRYIERLAGRDYTAGTVAAWCVDAGVSYSGPPITVVTGLAYLTGLDVMAVADGVARGPFHVVGGQITLPVAASNIVVGLGFQSVLQTLYLDVGAEGRVQGKRKKISAMSVRVKDTAGALKMGTSPNTLTPFRPGLSSTDPTIPLPSAPPGMTVGDMRMVMDPAYQVVGSVYIQQDDPLPVTVLGVVPEITLGDT